MKVSYKTDIGKVREKNEDSIYYDNNGDYIIAIVADGMGGHKSGEIASNIAVEEAGAFFIKNISDFMSSPLDFIPEIFYNSCKKVYEESKKMDDYEGMGTTMSMVIINKKTRAFYIGNVGDSRVYIVRKGEIFQITEDHSLVNEMYKKGQISKSELSTHPQRNVLTKALGTCERTDPDFFKETLEGIDYIILCTDGLSNYISDNEILKYIINSKDDPATELIEEAKKRGGSDNISVIIIDNEIEV